MVLLKLIAFAVFVPLMAIASLAFLAAAILIIHLGVFKFGDGFVAWLDRQFGVGGILTPYERPTLLTRAAHTSLAGIFAVLAYFFMWGVVHTISNFRFFLS